MEIYFQKAPVFAVAFNIIVHHIDNKIVVIGAPSLGDEAVKSLSAGSLTAFEAAPPAASSPSSGDAANRERTVP